MAEEMIDNLISEMKQLADKRGETVIDFPKYLDLLIKEKEKESEN